MPNLPKFLNSQTTFCTKFVEFWLDYHWNFFKVSRNFLYFAWNLVSFSFKSHWTFNTGISLKLLWHLIEILLDLDRLSLKLNLNSKGISLQLHGKSIQLFYSKLLKVYSTLSKFEWLSETVLRFNGEVSVRNFAVVGLCRCSLCVLDWD